MLSDRLARLALSADRLRCGMKAHYCEVDGQPWHFLQGGRRGADTLLMLHGFGADKDNWTRFAGQLSRDYHIVIVDLPGFGDNPCRPGLDYSMAAQAERLCALLEQLSIACCHVLGSSMGGHLAALYAHRFPNQVLSLCLFSNGGIKAPQLCDMERALQRGVNPLLVSSEADFDRLLALVTEKRPFLPKWVRAYMARAAVARRECIAGIFRQYQQEIYGGLEGLLADLQLPVLVIWGQQDRVLDVSSCEVMRPLLGAAEFEIMADTGHLPMLERPAATARRYRRFLAERV